MGTNAPLPPFQFDPIYSESEDTILGRLLDPFQNDPDPAKRYSVREGSILWDWASIQALEFLRAYERLNQVAGVGFLVAAFGDYLDQKGVELNLPRQTSTPASAVLTIQGTNGTIIPIGTRFSTTTSEGSDEVAVEVATTVAVTIPVGGVITVLATATQNGVIGNVPETQITQMVDVVSGIVFVTNDSPATGGTEDETDDEYRARLLGSLRAAAGPGTVDDYLVWALEYPGVEQAIVYPHWSGGGTVKVVLIGPDGSIVTTDTLRAAQAYFDPSVVLLAAFEADEAWTGATGPSSTNQAEGKSSLQVDAPLSATTTVTLPVALNLGFVASNDVFEIYVVPTVGFANLTNVQFILIDNAGLTASVTKLPAAFSGLGIAQWLTWLRSDMTIAGGFNWANVQQLQVKAVVGAGGAFRIHLDSWRVRDKDGGLGQGKAPIGAQVTVSSARPLNITVTATITPAPGFTVAGLHDAIQASIADLFDQVRQRGGTTLYGTDVGNAIHDVPGVLTFSGLLLNGAANAPLMDTDIPVLQTLTLS